MKKLLFLPFIIFSAHVKIASAITLEMPLPGMPSEIASPDVYIKYLFTFGMSLIGFLAVLAIIIGGLQYMAGSVTSIGKAKETIQGALLGVFMLIISYLILWTIDPTLTNLTPSVLDPIDIEEVELPDNDITEGTATIGANSVKCKSNYMCDDLKNGKASQGLISALNSLPVNVSISETTRSHGCFDGDPCAGSKSTCNPSNPHCLGRAVDIRVKDLSSAQQEQVMKTLSQDKCVDQLFFKDFPQYCRVAGGQNGSQSSACKEHEDHIHFTAKANCN